MRRYADLPDQRVEPPALVECRTPLALSRAFLLLVARGARVYEAGLHFLATRQRAVPRGRSWEKSEKRAGPKTTAPLAIREHALKRASERTREECSHSSSALPDYPSGAASG